MILNLAWRNLWRRKRRTAITMASVAIGVGLCLFFTGISDGMYGRTISAAVRMGSGHLVIEHPDYRADPALENSVPIHPELVKAVTDQPAVEGYSIRISGPGIISSSYGTVGGGFDAVDPELDESVSLIARNIETGRYLQGDRDIVVGTDLARKLKVDLGSKVVVMTQDRDRQTVQELFRVVGIFHTRAAMMDGFYFQVPLEQARAMLGFESGEATQLGIYLHDQDAMGSVKAAIESSDALAASGAVVVPWQQVLKDLADYMKVDNAFNYIFQVLLFLVILAGVLNTILMSVMERTYEFGVLLSIGMSRWRLMAMVVIEGALLGILGTVAGALLGLAENELLSRHPIRLGGVSDMSVGGFFMEPALYMDLKPAHLAITLAIVFLLTLFAGLYPAWKAAQVEPVEALHVI